MAETQRRNIHDNTNTPLQELEVEEEASIYSSQLPPVDGGEQAWKFLAGLALINSLIWSLPESYPVFQEHYVSHGEFDAHGLSLVGTLNFGLIYMSGPIIFPLVNRYPRQRKLMLWGGLFLSVGGCIGASFATKLWHLILTQGLLCAIGASLLYGPGVVLLNEWFQRKRGFAAGIMLVGTDVAGVLGPMLSGWLLEKYGFRTSLRVWAVISIIMASIAIPFVRGRVPVPIRSASTQPLRQPWHITGLLGSPTFWLISLANLFEAIAHYVPILYLPTYASGLLITSTKSTVLVSIANASSIPGRLLAGFLSDKVDLSIPTFLCPAISAVSVFALWGAGKGFAALAGFAVVYGTWGGGWAVLWSRFCTLILKERNGRGAGSGGSSYEQQRQGEDIHLIALIYGSLSFGRGIGSVVTGPVTTKLLQRDLPLMEGSYGLEKYKGLVLMTGTSMVLCAWVAMAGRFWKVAKRMF